MSNPINPFDYGKAWCQEFLFPDGGYDSRTWPRIRFSIEADSLGIFCNNTDLGKIAVSGILFNRRSDAILFDEAKAKILLGGPASIADSLHTHSGVGSLALDDLSDVNAPAPNDQDVLTWDAGAGEWVAAAGGGAEADPVVGAVTGIVTADGAGNISGITDNSSDWDTAYGWGDHSSVGYFVVGSDTLDDITDGVTYGKPTLAQIGNWDALVSFPGFSDLATDYGFTDNSSDWDTAYGWGNHSGLYTVAAHATTEDAIDGLVTVDGAGNYSATDPADFAAAGHTHALDDLSDVNAATPNDGDALTWDSGTSKWIAEAGAGYTDEEAQDAVGAMIADTNTINLTYTDATPELKADVAYQDSTTINLSDDASGLKADAITQMSVTADASGLKLSGDSAAPGNSMVYGTDGTGTKGWQASQNVATTASPSFVGATLTGLTAGSVLFAGASKEVAQDNSYFYYDDTNNRLGIGNKAPVGVIHANHSALANVGVFERSGATNNTAYVAGRILATKTSDMADGFGSALMFSIQDDAAVINNIGLLGFTRAGNDTTGKFIVKSHSSGAATETFSVTNTGAGSLLSGMTINEGGNDADTRIEGDTDANLIVCDASADKVGIGTATPAEKLDVVGNIKVSGNLTDGTESLTIVELADGLMAGSGNATWVPCVFEGGTNCECTFTTVTNTGTNDAALRYMLPLPVSRGGKTLYVSGYRVGIYDADSSDYVKQLRVFTLIATGWNDFIDSGAVTWGSAAGVTPYEVSSTFAGVSVLSEEAAGRGVFVGLGCHNTIAGNMDISYVQLQCYYA